MYATQQDMVDRFGATELIQLTDRTGANAIDAAVLGRALADADSEIDGHLQGRYVLPLASTPPILTTYACDIARYRLYDDRATEQVTKRYDSAMRFLRLAADGKVTLGLDGNGDAPASAGGPSFAADDRVFTREKLSDYTGGC